IFEAATQAGKTPQQFVDAMSARCIEVLKALDVSYDGFIRTSDEKKHIPTVKKAWQQLKAKGDIYKENYRGRYCTGCEAFLRDTEIRDGACIIHEKSVQDVYEENYFFWFSKYAKEVERLVREDVIAVIPEHRKKEILNLFSEEGVKDVSVSRPAENVKWGIPVPNDESQIMYVWVDALLNYLSGIGFDGEQYKKWWPPDAQIIGKDIARFHTMMWPALLVALELDLPKKIYVHGHISVEGKKISKSLGNVIDPFELVQKYGKDAVRYFLLREIPSDDDGDFSFPRLHERYTSDLQNGLGNLVSRTTTLALKYPDVSKGLETEHVLGKSRTPIAHAYRQAIEEFQLHRALAETWKLVNESNKLIEETKLWETIQTDPSRARGTAKTLAENLHAIGILLMPFLPETAGKVLAAVGMTASVSLNAVSHPVQFQKPAEPLFPKIES
ncbi:methionine--tRNA ligase, partial [Candidatus Azambacteria bacterium]|nr:methionine--tRNA ligase [Candidatus Azambacteria bacterium]